MNPLILVGHCFIVWHHDTQNKFKRKWMNFTLTRNFKFHFNKDLDEMNPLYYAMIFVNVIFQFWTIGCSFKGSCSIKLIQISKRQCFVNDMSTIEFDAYHGCCAGAGVRKLLDGGVLLKWTQQDYWHSLFEIMAWISNDIQWYSMGCMYPSISWRLD